MQSTPLHERNKPRPCTLLSFHSDNSSDINLAGHNRVALTTLRISMPVQTGWFQLSLCLFLGLCSSVSLRQVKATHPVVQTLRPSPLWSTHFSRFRARTGRLALPFLPCCFLWGAERKAKCASWEGRGGRGTGEAPKRKSQIVSPHMYYRPWSSAGWLGVLAS